MLTKQYTYSELECLDAYQTQLHSIYSVNVPHSVSDFVTSDLETVSMLTRGNKDHSREKLLVLQEGEDISLSLYLHRDVIHNLVNIPVETQLNPENIENLCLAIEGISHFLYLIWRALRQHEVSLFELELQAEVDKYIVLLSLIRKFKKYDLVSGLHRTLFEEIKFDQSLNQAELKRYQKANYYAARYCSLFKARYLQEFGSREMFNELREFYRLGQNAKLRKIENYPL